MGRRRPYHDQYDAQPGAATRSFWWWVFCAPGAMLIWVEYMFPRRGQVWASGRRYGNRIIQIVYSLGLYVIVGFGLYTLLRH
jgi:hypothetical protein